MLVVAVVAVLNDVLNGRRSNIKSRASMSVIFPSWWMQGSSHPIITGQCLLARCIIQFLPLSSMLPLLMPVIDFSIQNHRSSGSVSDADPHNTAWDLSSNYTPTHPELPSPHLQLSTFVFAAAMRKRSFFHEPVYFFIVWTLARRGNRVLEGVMT